MQDVLTLILGGGRGTRLYPLTQQRSEPAVPLAGQYRLIDVPVSNSLNSGLNRIYVLTQFLSVSLHQHIAQAYKVGPFSTGFVEVLAAQQTNEAADWYKGTADALRQNIRYVREDSCTDILVLSGDQLYRMDFAKLLATHRSSHADVTLAVLPVDHEHARRLGVVRLDEADRVQRFQEKPEAEGDLELLQTPAAALERRGVNCPGKPYLASMGIYLFTRQAFFEMLDAPQTAMDLVREILVPSLAAYRIHGYLFTGYWEDLGSIKSYHEANLALAGDSPPFDFNASKGVIYTRMRNLPAAHVNSAQVSHCLISDGCRVDPGCRLERCVIGVRSQIGTNVTLRDTIMFGADQYESAAQKAANRQRGEPDVGVGEGSVVQRAIIDKQCRIGKNVRIGDRITARDFDGPNYFIRDGIVVVPKRAVVKDGTVI
jgi:glucose-1-phosphate adenylyltransferase